MKPTFYRTVCVAALLWTGINCISSSQPAYAQAVEVSFESFHDQLAPYGDWVYSDRWGEVWVPNDVPDDFRPYDTNGYWVDTDDYGWTWVSNYEWGDIPFHYGRWVNDPDDGWLWLPGYEWGPGWVVWRSNDQYTGWMPMPPDREFMRGATDVSESGVHFSIDFGNVGGYYGYSDWYGPRYDADRFAANWIFVGTGHINDRDFHSYEAPRTSYTTIVRNTTNVTNYTVVNNTVINRSVDPNVVARASGHAIQPVHASAALHNPQLITHVDQGHQAQANMQAAMPRGTGKAGSAPPPPPQVVNSLSTKVSPHNGHEPSHLYGRDTIAKAQNAGPSQTNTRPPTAQPSERMTTRPEPTESQHPSPIPQARPPSGEPAASRSVEHNREINRPTAEPQQPPHPQPEHPRVQHPEQHQQEPVQHVTPHEQEMRPPHPPQPHPAPPQQVRAPHPPAPHPAQAPPKPKEQPQGGPDSKKDESH